MDIKYQREVTELVNNPKKKGGFYDIDEKLRYPKTHFFYPMTVPSAKPMEDFTFEEERYVKFYVNFHIGYKNTLHKIIQHEIPSSAETIRLFALAMWFNTQIREKVVSKMWD